MANNSIFQHHRPSRLNDRHISAIGLRVVLTLLSIAAFSTTRPVGAETFADAAGPAAAIGVGSASASADSGAGGELAPWDSGFDRLDVCDHSRDIADACATCPGLLPTLGISARQCCLDPEARRVCAEAAAAILIGRAVGSDKNDNVDDDDQDDSETSDVISKRAKYFLGKRAKYFLGKRAFGARRAGAFRPATNHELMAEDFSVYGSGRRGHGGQPLAADKRAKYFLG